YLGPDENVSPELIDWLVERARERRYPMPGAFISSKPAAGVNHKEYGVTSEGVTVFLEEALHHVGIDPRTQPFTVKLTGGPDGDVAGNEIKILRREYGDNARIVLISDGSGFASDPEGLDGDELLRLVDASLPIVHFRRERLSPVGEIVSVDDPEGVRRRNLAHNAVVADAFVPAGGRPETIHRYNWQSFLIDGTPSARVIVEGANLF
ncbi:MAG: amino acid dehydrogenase, partial [Myxococcota bacterium]